MRGVIYARYSPGPHQTEQSIEGQVADCQQYAEEHGIDIIEIYADRHVSGKSVVGRDEFQRMLRDAEKGRFDCVLVWKIDRFGRDRQDIAMGKMALKRAGVKLMYARESVPEGPEGIILESVLEGLAEYYSADLRQKVIRGMKETAKKGQYCGQSLPIGYKVDAERHIVVDEREAAVVREAFKLHIAGGQIRDIVQLFADRGIMGRRGKPVSNAVVYRMLRNEKYLGEFYIQDVKLNVEPIIDQATFLEAARHFKTSRNNAAGRAKVNYLLSCKMFCGYCGSMISAEAGTGKLGKVYRYYKCGDKKRGKKCELKPFPKDHLEDAIILATVNDMLTDEMIEKLTVRILEVQEQENADDPVVGLRRRLDSNKKRQRNLLDAIEEGGARGLVSRLAALEEEEEQLVLEIQRAEIKRPRLTHEVVEAWLRSFRVGDVTDDDFRARLVDTFIARVELRNDEALIFYNIREKGPHSRVRVRPEWWASSTEPVFTCLRDGGVVLTGESARRELLAHGVKLALDRIADRVKRAGDADLLAACSGVVADLIGHSEQAGGELGSGLSSFADGVEQFDADVLQLGVSAGRMVAAHLPELIDRLLGRDQTGLIGELRLVAGDVGGRGTLVDVGFAVGLCVGALVQSGEAGAHELVGAVDLGIVRDGIAEQGSTALVKELKVDLFHVLMPPCDR